MTEINDAIYLYDKYQFSITIKKPIITFHISLTIQLRRHKNQNVLQLN